MKHLITLFALISLCGCNFDKPGDSKPDIADGRTWLLYDFRQITQYPELADDDFDNGTFNYWFYKNEDFLNVSFSAVNDETIINGALDEFKSVMKKRNVKLPIKVSVFEKTIHTSDTTSTSTGLIKTFETIIPTNACTLSLAPPAQSDAKR